MLRKESKTASLSWTKTRRLNEQKKKKMNKNISTKTKQTAAAAGGARRNPRRSGPVNYGDVPAEQFANMLANGMDEESKQLLKAMLVGDDSGASASDDNNSASEVRCFPRRIVGSSVRACCANEMMPAQVSSPESVHYDTDSSVASSAGGTSVVSEPFVAKRQAKTVAKRSNAETAGQVSSLRAARSVDPLLRATCGGSCSLRRRRQRLALRRKRRTKRRSCRRRRTNGRSRRIQSTV